LDNPRRCLLVERFVSRAAFDEHLASPHYKELALDYIVPRLEGRTIEQFDVPASDAE
jgi:quinol monooxygenase YgiN